MAWGAAVEKLAEFNRLTCPDLVAKDRKMLGRLTPRPPHWQEKGVTKGELLAHIDKLELGEQAKAAAGKRVLEDFDRCCGEAKPAS